MRLRQLEVVIGLVLTAALGVGIWLSVFGWAEALGFLSGAICVWLTVKQNIWNWPIGILNNGFFIVLFLQAGLYADTGLQVVYIGLGGLGWYWWLHGGENQTRLGISHLTPRMLMLQGVSLIVGTAGLMLLLTAINGSAPFLDALTTSLSLIAQYLLSRKIIENWYVWISADLIYIGLYASKGLYLTSGLYFIFLLMCLVGVREWYHSLNSGAGRNETVMPGARTGAEVVQGD